MPYKVEERDGKHCVINTETDEQKACHDTREEADRQVKILHGLEHGTMDE